MIERKESGLHYFEFSHFRKHPAVVHGLFSRRGGTSQGPFESLDMGQGTSDPDEAVRRNRRMLEEELNVPGVLSLKQVHGDTVICWDRDQTPDCPPEADAVITDRRGVLLMIRTADCQAVLLLDPVKQVVANIHSGWRGSVTNIIGKTVGVMADRYGCDPADILAGIGPSLGPCCAEFVNYESELPPEFWPYRDKRRHFDFWQISRSQLESAGVKPESIRVSGWCTACPDNKDLFFSYRRDKLTGRLANVIGLKG